MTPIDRILHQLRKHGSAPKRSGDGWTCRCPAHEDNDPSLSVGQGTDGRVLLHCHAGCTVESVVNAIGLEMRDLHEAASKASFKRSPVSVSNTGSPAGSVSSRLFHSADAAIAALETTFGRHSKTWAYVRPDGEPEGITVRWDRRNGKKVIRPVSRCGNDWTIGGMREPRPILYLPKVIDADHVVITEGEKSADALNACGFVTTTSAGGSNAARKSDWSPMHGKDVVVIPDRNDAGELYCNDVVELVQQAGAKSVRVVRLWERWPEIPAGGDAADALVLGGGDVNAVREVVEKLAESAIPIERPEASPSLQYIPFPVGELPNPIGQYVMDCSAALGCDESFVALPLLSALSAAIGNGFCVEAKRSWRAPAVVWTIVIAESGTRKSPAMKKALRPVRERQRGFISEHKDQQQTYELELESFEIQHAEWKKQISKGETSPHPDKPQQPVCRRTWTDDVTTEGLVRLLQSNPRGILLARDELSGWFGSMDAYRGGRGGDLSRWLEVFDAGALTVDRKTSEPLFVDRAAVSIAGGIQPGVLRRSVTASERESGLLARFLLAMPPRRVSGWVEHDEDAETIDAVQRLFDRLYDIEPQLDPDGNMDPCVVALAPQARRLFVAFVDEHAMGTAERCGDEAAAWSKLEGYALRLALVLHMVMHAASDRILTDITLIEADAMARAISLVRWFTYECDRVYRVLDADEPLSHLYELRDWIAQGGKNREPGMACVRDLMQKRRQFRGDKAGARAALQALVDASLAVWDHEAAGKPGRPSERIRLV